MLQRELGEHGIGAKSITTEDGDYGQMLISRWPMGDTRSTTCRIPSASRAAPSPARIATPHGPLRFVATHLGLSTHERRGQTEKLLDIAGNAAMPTIVMGDFNDWFWVGSVRSALSRALPGCTRFRTFPSSARCCGSTASIAARAARW